MLSCYSGEKEARWTLLLLKEGCRQVTVSLFFQVINFFAERMVKHLNKLPGEAVVWPSLEVFKTHVNVVCRDMVQWCGSGMSSTESLSSQN